MGFARKVVAAILLAGTAFAQTSQWTDATTGLTFESFPDPYQGARFSYAFPSSTTGTEFIGEWVIPIKFKWAGFSLGGSMNYGLLLMAWPNGNTIMSSTRRSTNYEAPAIYAGPTITTISAGTTINATHWKWLFRCQNCTSWQGASGITTLDQTSIGGPGGYVLSLDAPSPISSSSAVIVQHTYSFNFGMSWGNAHYANYADYLDGAISVTASPSTSTAKPTSTSSSAIATISATPYDYIVVGAGVAGTVVADRLSEAGKKVLLIERGGPSTLLTGGTDTPTSWPTKTNLTRFDIPGLFENEFNAVGVNPYWWCPDHPSFSGCLVGGGSAINGELYWYPTDVEFSTSNGWPSGWQTPNDAINKVAARLPSTDTPSPDGKRYLTQVYDVVSGLLSKQGYTATTINSARNQKDHVYGNPGYYIKGGKRTGVMDTYLQTAKARSNFKLLTNTRVLSLVRNGATVTGVRTDNLAYGGNGIIPLTSKGRVILSAGVYGTTKVLFQSGIGPSDMISLVAADATASKYLPPSSQYINLPVGSSISDNPSVNLVYTHPSVDSYDNWAPIWTAPRAADANQYVKSQTGVFASSSPRINFWRAYGATDSVTRYVQGTSRPGGSGFTATAPYNESAIFTITLYLSTGLTSKGRIGIDSSLQPQILKNPWFTDPIDTTTLVTALNDIVTAGKQVSGLTLISPDLTTTDMTSFAKSTVVGSNHWISTTKIGTSASTSVVDSNTKVWNTNNLFVVDAGILPGTPMSNPTGAILVAAELAAAKILALAGGA